MTDPLINARSAFGRTDGPPKHGPRSVTTYTE
jgi:hypothetical protein